MKKLLLAAALIAFPGVAKAQNQISATATIANAFAYPANRNLSFGTITPLAAGNTARTITQADAGAGYVQVWTNTKTTVVTVDLSAATLTGASTGNTLAAAYTCSASATTTAPASLGTCSSGQSFTHARAGKSNETFSLWFGGSIGGAAIDNAAADAYSGRITVNVTSQAN
jgi:hypothetical protein